MESIADTDWDVLIAGGRALSRSDKKILHVDINEYYGGTDAALTLQDAEDWVKQIGHGSNTRSGSSVYSDARLSKTENVTGGGNDTQGEHKLGFSRAYSLALAPQIIYMRSAFQAALLSSKIFRQLEFMAVGSWFVCETKVSDGDGVGGSSITPLLRKIPNSREDVFADKNLGLKAKRSLISFQRLFREPEAQAEALKEHGETSLSTFLTEQYSLPSNLQEAVNALTLSPDPPNKTLVNYALPRIARHVTSMGVAGLGFGAVIPKWGGLAEVTQVACRAQAVGGGVYMLGKGVKNLKETSELTEVTLTDDTTVKCRYIAGTFTDLPNVPPRNSTVVGIARSIFVISASLDGLFAPLAEDGPRPAVAVVYIPTGLLQAEGEQPSSPIYLMIHSAESGECPRGQCIIYSSMQCTEHPSSPHTFLQQAAEMVLETQSESKDKILMKVDYMHSMETCTPEAVSPKSPVMHLQATSLDLAFDDAVLKNVRDVWQKITGEEEGFLAFEDREAGAYDDEHVDADDEI